MANADPPNNRTPADPNLERIKREIKALRIKSDDIIEKMKALNQKIEAMEEERRTRRENERKGN